jgi:hypothetical protein
MTSTSPLTPRRKASGRVMRRGEDETIKDCVWPGVAELNERREGWDAWRNELVGDSEISLGLIIRSD